jgi:hypothetical protein
MLPRKFDKAPEHPDETAYKERIGVEWAVVYPEGGRPTAATAKAIMDVGDGHVILKRGSREECEAFLNTGKR